MAWERKQIAAAHIVKTQLAWNDPQYRLVLQNVAGVHAQMGKVSSTNPSADTAGFVRYMAFAERQGFVDGKNGAGYWEKEAAKQCSRIHWKISELAGRGQRAGILAPDALGGFIERMTQERPAGPTRVLDDVDWEWSYKILEGLKAWLYRESRKRGIPLGSEQSI